MKDKPFLKRYSFLKCLKLSEEEVSWLQTQCEKEDVNFRYGLLLEFFLNYQDVSKEFAKEYLQGEKKTARLPYP